MTVVALALRNERAISARPTFQEVAEVNLDAVYRYLRHLTGDPHLAEDLTSETFERALRMWGRFEPTRGPALPWLVAIARRIALDHFRSDARRRTRDRRAAAGDDLVAPPPAEPTDLPPDIGAALAKLTQSEREIVALRVLLDLDGAETAATLGISPSACSTQLHRAMTKLRAELSR
jgi:RNA polymerase sigma-70 factor (ECF subfamily)